MTIGILYGDTRAAQSDQMGGGGGWVHYLVEDRIVCEGGWMQMTYAKSHTYKTTNGQPVNRNHRGMCEARSITHDCYVLLNNLWGSEMIIKPKQTGIYWPLYPKHKLQRSHVNESLIAVSGEGFGLVYTSVSLSHTEQPTDVCCIAHMQVEILWQIMYKKSALLSLIHH